MKSKKGFTLIEMLIVIAIIAVLVAVVIPVINVSTTKAKAATDATNLHSIHAIANSAIVGNEKEAAFAEIKKNKAECASFPDAKMMIAYCYPAFVKIYYVDGDSYYDIDYFSDVASKGKSSRSTAKPEFPGQEVEWFDLSAVMA